MKDKIKYPRYFVNHNIPPGREASRRNVLYWIAESPSGYLSYVLKDGGGRKIETIAPLSEFTDNDECREITEAEFVLLR